MPLFDYRKSYGSYRKIKENTQKKTVRIDTKSSPNLSLSITVITPIFKSRNIQS